MGLLIRPAVTKVKRSLLGSVSAKVLRTPLVLLVIARVSTGILRVLSCTTQTLSGTATGGRLGPVSSSVGSGSGVGSVHPAILLDCFTTDTLTVAVEISP